MDDMRVDHVSYTAEHDGLHLERFLAGSLRLRDLLPDRIVERAICNADVDERLLFEDLRAAIDQIGERKIGGTVLVDD